MKFYIHHNGDMSVGISGEEATLEIDLSGYDGDDLSDHIEFIKQEMAQSFTAIWGFKAHVMTVNEVKD